MIITKKWTACTLAAILTAANLAAPLFTVSALGAQTQPAQISAETSFEDVPEADTLENAAAAKDMPGTSGEDPEAVGTESESTANEEAEAEDESESPMDPEESVSETDAEEEPACASTVDPGETVSETNAEEEPAFDSAADPEEDAGAADTESANIVSEKQNEASAPAETGSADDTAPDGASDTQYEDENNSTAAETDIPEGAGTGETIPPARRSSFRRYTPSQDDVTDADNDDLFAAYVNRELELTGSLQADTGDYEVSTPAQDSQYAFRSLTGNDQYLYALLLNEIKAVAAGDRANTEFEISLEDLGLEGKTWSASDLGVSTIVTGNGITDEAMDSLNEIVLEHLTEIWTALLADCPYELYWHDKEIGIMGGSGFDTEWSGDEYRLRILGPYILAFTVSADYSASGNTETFEVNTTIGQSVQTARNTARSIVNRYAGRSDYEKLDSYRKEICDLTDYNDDAAATDAPVYGNPWQLIWVFDKDPATDVVCEGYAKGFQYLCDLSTFNGIFKECISVTGDMDGTGHMWNIVALQDNRSYLVDVTNCDAGSIGCDYDEESDTLIPGRNLFPVGTGPASSADIYASGSLTEGYLFPKLDYLTYIYDADTRNLFDDAILTLAPGRVTASTTTDGSYSDKMIPETGVELSLSTLTMKKGSTQQLTATVKPSNATDKSVTWKSDNPAVASVSATGKVTAVTGGTATITVVTNHLGFTDSCTVTVTEPVTDLYFDEDYILLRVGSSVKLPVHWTPSNAVVPKITWTSSDPSIVTVDKNGTVKASKYGSVLITAKTSDEMTAYCEIQTLFKDVYNQGKSYFYPVYWAVNSGITVCTVNFRPDDPVTRGEFVAFLWRLAGKPKSFASINFLDVDKNTKFYDAIRWAVDVGIIKGYSDRTFRPENNVTRGETATMLWRFDDRPTPKTNKCPFSDLKASSADSYRAILWGSENGIIKGSGGKFLKNDNCTRGQVVTFLYRYVDYLYQ